MSRTKQMTAAYGVILCLLLVALCTNASDNPLLHTNGIWSIMPPLAAIVLAFISQNVIVSLLSGVLIGTFLISLNGFNPAQAVPDAFTLATYNMLGSLSDSWNAGIILQVLTIGGLVALITKMGGARAIAESLAKKADGPTSSQLITWLMGLIVFFDDYANSLIVGPIMRPITDKAKISREKLAFIVDATAAPIAGIALISTWIGAEISYIKEGLDLAAISNITPYNLFVLTIPYRFYNILMLAFVVMTAVFVREFGPMLAAENRARGGQHLSPQSADEKAEPKILTPQDTGKSSIWMAIIPLGVLIVASFAGFYLNGRNAILAGEDAALIQIVSGGLSFEAIRECFGNSDASIVLFQSALLACFTAFAMGILGKKFTMNEGIETWLSGVRELLITCVILILAWSLSATIRELGTAAFLVQALAGVLPAFIVPALIFLLASIVSFSTGTSYGTMGILLPLAIPFAATISPDNMNYLLACSSAVLTGAIFGDHCSPISDTTILSSMGAGCDHIVHVKTQMWYAISVAAIVFLFCYIPLGLGLSIWIALPLGLAACAALLLIVGKRPTADASPKA